MFKKKREYHWPTDKEILDYIAWGDPGGSWPEGWNPDANYAINLVAVVARAVLDIRDELGEAEFLHGLRKMTDKE